MNRLIAKLILFTDSSQERLLKQMGQLYERFYQAADTRESLIAESYRQIKALLEIATDFGFDRNLWHHYLTFLLITNENPFSLTCEKVGKKEGSVNFFAQNDCKIFKELFDFDFTELESALGIDCFTRVSNYQAIKKPEFMYNQNVSEKVKSLSLRLAAAANEQVFFDEITQFYGEYGVGMFGLNKAFRIIPKVDNTGVIFNPINNMDKVMLADLVGYENQKQKLVENTKAFVEGRKANNVLLFGDSGTGKSTSIKAIVNEFYHQGLRMIEIYKHQFRDLSNVIAQIKNRNYRFIIYMDDLSFEEFEIEYKFLKAVIEGGVETKPDNILIYATSNRRHLIRETWNDRNDMEANGEIHRSDTMQEKLSLVNRFGVSIFYERPSQKQYFGIVAELARREGLNISEEVLSGEANKWELQHGGISGRTAQQFINHLLSVASEENLMDKC
ncbi:ATP-binding protein [Acetobacterium malicum]|uniref:ATP-binding protein n=1 Tax=Acetobacterium malicum TaxID=52692 RepID=UPI00040AF0DE|nr:ATP-binding protein [Acetobacterium dehalogenans]